MTSPTQRTLAECRKRGWHVQVVERWNQYARIRQDLFGVIDLVAIVPGRGILGIQATDATSHSKRVAKVLEEPRAIAWVKAGGLLQVWSWSKRREPGKKREQWTLRAEELVVKARASDNREPLAQ